VLRPGDRWSLRVRLKRPNGTVNPGGFDREKWLFARGIDATGYVRRELDGPISTALGARLHLDRARARLYEEIEVALQGRRFAGVIAALCVGVRSGVTAAQWEVFRRTGTAHLMAISGLHIGLAAGLGALLLGVLARLPGVSERLPRPIAAALGAALCATAYAGLAGFSLPTSRALIMVGLAVAAVVARRRLALSMLFAATAWSLVLIDPATVLTSGFWLSLGTVGVLFYGLANRFRPPRERTGSGGRGVEPPRWKAWIETLAIAGERWCRPQWTAAMGLLGLLAAVGYVPAPLGFIANLLAIPWVGFLVIPLALSGTALLAVAPPLAAVLLRAADVAMGWLWPTLELGAKLDHMLPASSGVSGIEAAVLGAIGAALLLLPRALPGRRLGFFVLAPLVWAAPERPPPGEAWLHVLDVGQGLSVVVETHRRVLVYDTGPRSPDGYDAGARVVAPFLAFRHWPKIDTMLLSHSAYDHQGGFAALGRLFPIDRLIANFRPAGAPPGWVPERCTASREWVWDGVRFQILYPAVGLAPSVSARSEARSDNDESCTLRVSTGGQSMLLAGDLERGGEAALVARGVDLESDVLLVPHHGSRTSSSLTLLSAVRPRAAIISLGYHNRWKMPATRVLSRLRASGARVWRTDRDGAVRVVLGRGSRGPGVEGARQRRKRYWHRKSAL